MACRVDLDRLAAGLPRWGGLARIDARIRALEAGDSPAPRPTKTSAPTALPPVPDPPAPSQRPEPPVLAEMAPIGEDRAQLRQGQMAEAHQARLDVERTALESALTREKGARRDAAAEERWREGDAVIHRYQDPITRLRLRIGLLTQPSAFPGKDERRPAELAASREALAKLEAQRDAELEALASRLRARLATEEERDSQELARTLRELEDTLKRQREAAARTARQDWEERLEVAREALTEAPPGASPGAPVDRSAAAVASPLAPVVRIAPSGAGGEPRAAAAAVASLRAQRARLRQFLRAETRRRVLAIAREHHLAPRFDGDGRGLPDRTDFFARQLERLSRAENPG